MTPSIHMNVPNVTFKTRVRDETVEGPNPFRWQDVTSEEIFSGRKVVVFALPGAFTPTCSSTHLPDFEEKYDELKNLGVDEVYCLSVNDAFTMFQWGKHQGVEKVKLLPDGSGEFTRLMGMLVRKDNVGSENVPGDTRCWWRTARLRLCFLSPASATTPRQTRLK